MLSCPITTCHVWSADQVKCILHCSTEGTTIQVLCQLRMLETCNVYVHMCVPVYGMLVVVCGCGCEFGMQQACGLEWAER